MYVSVRSVRLRHTACDSRGSKCPDMKNAFACDCCILLCFFFQSCCWPKSSVTKGDGQVPPFSALCGRHINLPPLTCLPPLRCFPLLKGGRRSALVVTAAQTRTAELYFQARREHVIVVMEKPDVSAVRILLVGLWLLVIGCWLLAVMSLYARWVYAVVGEKPSGLCRLLAACQCFCCLAGDHDHSGRYMRISGGLVFVVAYVSSFSLTTVVQMWNMLN